MDHVLLSCRRPIEKGCAYGPCIGQEDARGQRLRTPVLRDLSILLAFGFGLIWFPMIRSGARIQSVRIDLSGTNTRWSKIPEVCTTFRRPGTRTRPRPVRIHAMPTGSRGGPPLPRPIQIRASLSNSIRLTLPTCRAGMPPRTAHLKIKGPSRQNTFPEFIAIGT